MTKRFDPEATALSAISNASNVPVRRADLKLLLATGTGEPSHVRALFSDVHPSTLVQLLIEYGISDATFAQAYARARDRYAAANPEIEALVSDLGLAPRP
ncbi:MAG: hypothetical protein JO273_10720 [Methylobacteriaceae bacterium]|nr:hypothetical protein [Methylobacteriaceae bacterium]